MPGQIIPLTDEEIMSVADDPQAVLKFTRDERRRLTQLRPPTDDIQPTLDALGPMQPMRSNTADESIDLRDALRWAGGALGGAFFGPAGKGMVDNPGTTLASIAIPAGLGRALPVAREAFTKAAPAMKTEAATQALRMMGVPRVVANRIAGMLSSSAKTTAPASEPIAPAQSPTAHVPANATSTQWGHVSPSSVLPAQPAVPTASTPAAVTPPVQTGAPAPAPPSSVGPKLYRQKIQNELGIQARRQKVTLSEAEYEQAEGLVRQGRSPAEAVATMKSSAPAAPVSKARLTAAESKEFARLVEMGKKPEEAFASIQMQRDLAQRLGTPTPESARLAVRERNRTGRWDK